MQRQEREWHDSQPLLALCAYCPEWSATGTAAETREAAREHRLEHHPKTFRKKRPQVRNLRSFMNRNMTKEQEEEVDRERAARMKMFGLEP